MTRKRLIIVAVSWLSAIGALQVSRAQPDLLVVGGIVVVLATVVFVCRDLSQSAPTVTWARHEPVRRFDRRNDPRVSTLRRQFTGITWQGSSAINDTLIDLLDDRLLVHHGIDRETDPSGADAALSPVLRQFVAAPERPLTGARQLRRIVTAIEAL